MFAALAFLIAATPLCLYAAWTDLRFMLIPNSISIALVTIFIALGVIFLPIDVVGWRLLAGFIVLAIGFVLNAIGIIGGGDVKLLAGFTPFVSAAGAPNFLMLFSFSLILTLALHRIAGRIGPIRRATADWKSWQAGRHFPMGISIALAAIAYLVLNVTAVA